MDFKQINNDNINKKKQNWQCFFYSLSTQIGILILLKSNYELMNFQFVCCVVFQGSFFNAWNCNCGVHTHTHKWETII